MKTKAPLPEFVWALRLPTSFPFDRFVVVIMRTLTRRNKSKCIVHLHCTSYILECIIDFTSEKTRG